MSRSPRTWIKNVESEHWERYGQYGNPHLSDMALQMVFMNSMPNGRNMRFVMTRTIESEVRQRL